MGWFQQDPKKKLQKEYEAKMLEARDAQRRGEIQRYAELVEQAEALHKSLTSE